jgi:hypothetical protein
MMNTKLEGRTLFEALSQLIKEGRSGRLRVEHWDGKEGVIGLNDGQIVHCQLGGTRGMEALRLLRGWISISFQFFENVENLSVDVDQDTAEILVSLEEQDHEIHNIQQVVPGPQVIFALSGETPDARVTLHGKLWRVLSLVNGRNSVKDICRALRATEFSVSKILALMANRRIIRAVALIRPLDPQHREPFFRELEGTLARYIGPIATVIIDDVLADMGKSREYVSRHDLPLLVERIGECIQGEKDRIQFQGFMLTLIQGVSKEAP